MGLFALAAVLAVSVRGTGPRPALVEAAWNQADETDGAATVEIEPPAFDKVTKAPPPGVTPTEHAAPGSAIAGDVLGDRQGVFVPQRMTSGAAPFRRYTELGSSQGLTDLVGPVVYGEDGQAGGTGDGIGGGTGSGPKSSFFGIHSTGRRIVYVVDASNSMNKPYRGEGKTRFGQMKIELARSILELKENQQFYIIFFNQHAIPMPSSGLEAAYPQSQQTYLTWVAGVPADGLTDPRPAIELALAMNPDVVYLLTDGAFTADVTSDLSRLRQRKVEFNTIAFGDPKAEKSLKPLAVHNRGRFAFVP